MTSQTQVENASHWKNPVFFELESVESVAGEEEKIPLAYTAPMIIPAEAELEVMALQEAYEPDLKAAKPTGQTASVLVKPPARALHKSPWLWLLGFLGGLLVFLLILDAWYFVAGQFVHSFMLGFLALVLVGGITATASFLTWRSYRNIQKLRTVSALQQEGTRIMENNGYGEALHYINRVGHFYDDRPEVKARLERFYLTSLNDSLHDRELCELFSTQVMHELDQKAYKIVLQRSKETALMVMISPVAIIDTVLTLWRNVRMIRDIATLYRGRPGFFGSLGLVTMVIQNMVYADVSELLADVVTDTLGNTVLSAVSTQAAQGVGSGILTARLGLRTMQVCRPIPFTEEERPRLKMIRREIFSMLKGMFERKQEDAPKQENKS